MARPFRHGRCSGASTHNPASLGEQQAPAILDRGLRNFGKTLQQPWQHDLHPHMIVRDVDMPRGGLPERPDTEDHAVILPSLLIDVQHRHAGRRARQSCLEAAHGLLATEAVRDRNDERCGHWKILMMTRLHVIPRTSK